MRRAFTLTELMIVIAIMAILAGLALSAYNGAMHLSREQRTRSEINRINLLIQDRWEDYLTRAVPMQQLPGGTNQLPMVYPTVGGVTPTRGTGLRRLLVLRAMMRIEMPDRRTDIVNFNTNPPSLEVIGLAALPGGTLDLSQHVIPAIQTLQKKYLRKAVIMLGGTVNVPSTYTVLSKWTAENEGAECLYLILSMMRDGDKSALDFFDPSEIGDTDGDGMIEILDGWGMPIKFIRWPAGYVPPLAPNSSQITNAGIAPDVYDPLKSDPQFQTTAPPFLTFPLIYSAGRDKVYDIADRVDATSSYRFAVPPSPSITNLPNNPYYNPGASSGQYMLGTPADTDGDGQLRFQDNITNQSRE